MPATLVDVRTYSGQYIAQDDAGDVIASAKTVEELEKKLRELGYDEDSMPAIQPVPEDGAKILLL